LTTEAKIIDEIFEVLEETDTDLYTFVNGKIDYSEQEERVDAHLSIQLYNKMVMVEEKAKRERELLYQMFKEHEEMK